MVTKHSIVLAILLFATLLFFGCYSGLQVKNTDEAKFGSEDIRVEAYLVDVKLRRKGKPTSFRLDLYQTDSAVAMYGRGYFNKGAFSGRLTSDSIQIYFPTAEEYLHESIENLFLSFDCESELLGLNLLSYFLNVPNSDSVSENLIVENIEDKDDEKNYKISSRNCPWVLMLTYSNEKPGWRIDEFEFDDNKEVSIKGNRRIYKQEAAVSKNRFEIKIPDGALKITL